MLKSLKTAAGPTLAELNSDSHPCVFSRVDLAELLGDSDKWLDNVDPLGILSVETVARCLKDATRGAWAELQWTWEQLEPADAYLATCVDRREAALKKLPWDIVKAEGLTDLEDAIAEAQLRTVRDFCNAITNLDEGIAALGQASFRGYKRIQMLDSGRDMQLIVTDNWNWCRDGYNGTWGWNPRAAYGMTRGEDCPVLESSILTRCCPRPIDQVAMMLCLDRKNAKAQWMCYNGRYGVPPLFVVLPAGTNPQTKEAYIKLARQCISNSSGVLPPGSDVKAVTVQSGTPDTFRGIIDMSSQEMVLRATGGLMTMLTAPGAGTNTSTGSTHQDGFDDLADVEGEDIAGVLTQDMIAPILRQWHPGQPQLVRMVIKRPDSSDTTASVANIATLASASYRATDDQVSELTGIEVTTQSPVITPGITSPLSAPDINMARRYAPTMLWPGARQEFDRQINSRCRLPLVGRDRNSKTDPPPEPDRPLTAEELAVLQQLITPPTAADIAQTAQALKQPLKAAMDEDVLNDSSAGVPPVATPLQNAGNGNAALLEEVADVDDASDINYGTSAGARKAAATRRQRGGFKGDTKEPRTRKAQTNPYQAPEGSSDKTQVKALTRAIDKTARKGGTVLKSVHKPGIGHITVKGGSVGKKSDEYKGGGGTSHMLGKHGKEGLTAKKAALITVKGTVTPNKHKASRKDIIHKGGRVIVDSELKFRSGRKNRKNSKIQTGFEEQ